MKRISNVYDGDDEDEGANGIRSYSIHHFVPEHLPKSLSIPRSSSVLLRKQLEYCC